jgi:hypothetical protein
MVIAFMTEWLLQKIRAGLGFPSVPLSADPEAAAILNSSARAVQAILAKRAALDAAGQRDTPLFVAMGEHHFRPAHKLHHLAVAKGLRDAGERIAFAFEQEHDFLAKNLCREAGLEEPREDIMNGLEGRDADGRIALSHFVAHGATSATYAFRLLSDYLLRNRIPARLTDCSRRNIPGADVSFIDARDEQSRNSLRKYAGDTAAPCSRLSDMGSHARNDCMAEKAIEFAREIGARIVLQQCGLAHATGRQGFSMEESLAGQFRRRGLPALSLLLDGDFYPGTPAEEDFRAASYDMLIDSAMPRREFRLRPDRITPPEEIRYTRALLAHMGLERDCGSAAALENRRLSCAQEFRRAMQAWRGEFGLGAPTVARRETMAGPHAG